MRARFIGDPRNEGEGPRVMNAFGLTFAGLDWVTLTAGYQRRSGMAIAKLIGNDHFEVEDDAGALLSPPSQEANEPDEDEDDEPGPRLSPDAGNVEIPAGWDELSAADLRKLAGRITGGAVPNKDAAMTVVEAELARRAALPPQD